MKQSDARRQNRPPRDLDSDILPGLLGYHLRRAQSRVFSDFAATVGETGITPGQTGIIALIHANPHLSQGELAAAVGLDKSTIAPAIDKLVRRKIVLRKPSPHDRRFNILSLTPAGEALYQELAARIARHEERIARRLSPEERRLLIDLLGRVTAMPEPAP